LPAKPTAGQQEIPEDIQDKLLSDYERELISKKLKKNTSKGSETLEEEMSKVKLLSEAAADTSGNPRASPDEKGEKAKT